MLVSYKYETAGHANSLNSWETRFGSEEAVPAPRSAWVEAVPVGGLTSERPSPKFYAT
jgi:hypothetical protein